MRFVDTHVKYGEKYDYEIFAVKAVIGTEYQMKMAPFEDQAEEFKTNFQFDMTSKQDNYNGSVFNVIDDSEGNFDLYGLMSGHRVMPIKIMLRPTMKIVEVPMHTEQDVQISDFPPMPPLQSRKSVRRSTLGLLRGASPDSSLTPWKRTTPARSPSTWSLLFGQASKQSSPVLSRLDFSVL